MNRLWPQQNEYCFTLAAEKVCLRFEGTFISAFSHLNHAGLTIILVWVIKINGDK